MEERVVFWHEGCQVYAGIIVTDGNGGWTKIRTCTRKYGDPCDTPEEARRITSGLIETIGTVLS